MALTSSPAPTTTTTGQVGLCVAVQSAKSSVQRGQDAQWTVTAWATGGDVAGVTIKLTSAPATPKPAFTFGCGNDDGGTSCALGALDASSAQRQLQAKVSVPATATVTSVRLTVAGSATGLPTDPQVSATTAVTAPVAASPSADTGIAPLTVGGIPYLPSVSPTLSPGGNAAALFPSLTPSPDPVAKAATRKASGRAVANTGALPLGTSVVGAQLAGLGVLALAFVLAVARLSIRRRPAPAQSGAAPAGPAGPSGSPNPPTGPTPPPGTAGQRPPGPADNGTPKA